MLNVGDMVRVKLFCDINPEEIEKGYYHSEANGDGYNDCFNIRAGTIDKEHQKGFRKITHAVDRGRYFWYQIEGSGWVFLEGMLEEEGRGQESPFDPEELVSILL